MNNQESEGKIRDIFMKTLLVIEMVAGVALFFLWPIVIISIAIIVVYAVRSGIATAKNVPLVISFIACGYSAAMGALVIFTGDFLIYFQEYPVSTVVNTMNIFLFTLWLSLFFVSRSYREKPF